MMNDTAEAIIGKSPVKVLDHGFVRLVDMMGGDAGVVQAARVSHGDGSKGPEADRKLIGYMLQHDHGSPFESAVLKFHVSCPILVMRQWIRHRIASYNEISFRYTEAPDEFYVPATFRAPSKTNLQGSVEAPHQINHAQCREIVERASFKSYADYQELLALGVAKEMARMVLPVNIYTQFYWTVNARSLMNFLSLRCEGHAQAETREYANALAPIFRESMPWTYESFVKSLSPEAKRLTQEGKAYARLS